MTVSLVVLLLMLANTVFATDAPTVPSLSVSPEAVKSNSTTTFALTVTNTSGDAIEKVVIDVPPAGTGGSNFNVTDAPAPAGLDAGLDGE